MADFVSRGFAGRRRGGGDRLRPGQYDEPGFPVLTAGPTPDVDTASWTLRIGGMVAQDAEWSWEEFHELVFEEGPCDLHCVTSWSKLGNSLRWRCRSTGQRRWVKPERGRGREARPRGPPGSGRPRVRRAPPS